MGPEKRISKIKACCFCERWESGGIESFLFNVLTRMDRDRMQIDVVAANLGESVFTEPLEELGVRFFELSGNQRNILENYRRFSLLLEAYRWDVIHLNIFHGLSLLYLHLAEQKGVPVRIAHSHNTALRRSLTYPVKLAIHAWAKKHFTQCATTLWACSENAAKFLFAEKTLKQKGFQLILNGIDVRRFCFDPAVRESTRKKLNLAGQYVVGNVGRLCYQKNQSFLLDVFSELWKQKPDSYLLLVGEGEDRSMLAQKARQLGIAEKVLFYGTTSHVEQLLWAMDAFILPSRFEGLPVTGVEAQATGLPCFFSDTVTERCKFLDSTEFLSLAKPPEYWANRVLEKAAAEDRTAAASAAQDAGFDILQTVRQVESGYRRSGVP